MSSRRISSAMASRSASRTVIGLVGPQSFSGAAPLAAAALRLRAPSRPRLAPRRAALAAACGLRFGAPLRRRGGFGAGFGADILAIRRQHRDRRVHRDAFGAFLDQNPGELALVHRLDLHRRLVGLDLGNDVAGLHLVADILQPFAPAYPRSSWATAPASGSASTSLSPPAARRCRARKDPVRGCLGEIGGVLHDRACTSSSTA